MRTKFFFLFLFIIYTTVYSQKKFQYDRNELESYANGIFNKNYKGYSNFDSTTSIKLVCDTLYRIVIGEKIPIYTKPFRITDSINKSDIIEYLNTRDTVLLPQFDKTNHYYLFVYDGSEGSTGSILVITASNNYGFIPYGIVHNPKTDILKIPNSDFILIKGGYKFAFVNEKNNVSNIVLSYDLSISPNGKRILIIPIENRIGNDPINKVYLYNPLKNAREYIINGYSPTFLDNSRILLFQDSLVGNKSFESIVLFDVEKRILYDKKSLPDSLTFKQYMEGGFNGIGTGPINTIRMNFGLFRPETFMDDPYYYFDFEVTNNKVEYRIRKK